MRFTPRAARLTVRRSARTACRPARRTARAALRPVRRAFRAARRPARLACLFLRGMFPSLTMMSQLYRTLPLRTNPQQRVVDNQNDDGTNDGDEDTVEI